jgi:hypothetical protein
MMIINAILNAIEDNDILSFELTPVLQVKLTDTQGSNDLLNVFVAILKILVAEDVSVQLIDNPSYTNQMYKDICAEYIAELNNDIKEARKSLLSEGLAANTD